RSGGSGGWGSAATAGARAELDRLLHRHQSWRRLAPQQLDGHRPPEELQQPQRRIYRRRANLWQLTNRPPPFLAAKGTSTAPATAPATASSFRALGPLRSPRTIAGSRPWLPASAMPSISGCSTVRSAAAGSATTA